MEMKTFSFLGKRKFECTFEIIFENRSADTSNPKLRLCVVPNSIERGTWQGQALIMQTQRRCMHFCLSFPFSFFVCVSCIRTLVLFLCRAPVISNQAISVSVFLVWSSYVHVLLSLFVFIGYQCVFHIWLTIKRIIHFLSIYWWPITYCLVPFYCTMSSYEWFMAHDSSLNARGSRHTGNT